MTSQVPSLRHWLTIATPSHIIWRKVLKSIIKLLLMLLLLILPRIQSVQSAATMLRLLMWLRIEFVNIALVSIYASVGSTLATATAVYCPVSCLCSNCISLSLQWWRCTATRPQTLRSWHWLRVTLSTWRIATVTVGAKDFWMETRASSQKATFSHRTRTNRGSLSSFTGFWLKLQPHGDEYINVWINEY